MPIFTLKGEASVTDGFLAKLCEYLDFRFDTQLIRREWVTLTAGAFTAFTVPTVPAAPKLLIILPGTSAINLTLKGVTGDTGVKIVPATAPTGCPLFITLGASPSIGILNSDVANANVELIWI